MIKEREKGKGKKGKGKSDTISDLLLTTFNL